MKKWIILLLCTAMLFSMTALADTESSACPLYKYGVHRISRTEILETPTCTDTGSLRAYCKCGYMTVTELKKDPDNHRYEIYDSTIPDCDSPGFNYLRCERCGAEKKERLEPFGHDYASWVTIRGATCAAAGEKKRACQECGFEQHADIDRKPHTLGAEYLLKEATQSSKGSYARTCSVCGGVFVSREYYPDGTLYRGMDKNDAVVELQQMLIDLKMLSDKADGIFGKNTEAAVKAFQQQYGLEPSGIAYPQTINSVKAAHTVWNIPAATEAPAPTQAPAEVGDGAYNDPLRAEEALLSTVNSEADNAWAWEQIHSLWQNELDRLFDEWTAQSSSGGTVLLESWRELFDASLAARLEVWSLCTEPTVAYVHAADELRTECAIMCVMTGCEGSEWTYTSLEEHLGLCDECADLFEREKQGDLDPAALWESYVYTLYERLSSEQPELRAQIIEARDLFLADLAAQRAIWQLLGVEDIYTADTLRRECVRICDMLMDGK